MARNDGKPQLTDSAIKKMIDEYLADGTRAELIDAKMPGLRIQPLRSGRAKWSLMVRDQSGRLKRFAAGRSSNGRRSRLCQLRSWSC